MNDLKIALTMNTTLSTLFLSDTGLITKGFYLLVVWWG